MLNSLAVSCPVAGASALAVTLEGGPLPALAARTVEVGGLAVELRLTGMGHQVIAGPVIETVGALDGRPGPLPYELSRDVGGWSYRFVADVYKRDATDFGHAVGFLRRYLGERRPEGVVVGEYDDRSDALAGILLRQDGRGFSWRAWHTFPRHRELAVTRGRMTVR